MIQLRLLLLYIGISTMIPAQFASAHFRFWQRFIPHQTSPQVKLQIQEKKGALLAILSVKNTSPNTIFLEKEKLGLQDTITMEVFFILVDGKPLLPQFPCMKRPPPTENDFIELKPNEIIQTEIHLQQAYSFPQGLHFYQILYDTSHHTKEGKLLSLRAITTPFFYKQESHSSLKPQYKLVAEITAATLGTDLQKKEIQDALVKQKEMIQQKLTDLESENWLKNEKVKNHFKTWFGKANEDYKKRIISVLKSMLKRNEATKLQNFQISSNRAAYAHVFGDDNTHMITVFEMFFRAPNDGINSKPGILCHEMSHFIDVAGSTDRIYGTKNSKQLAADDPEGAINNADNIEYYLENAN